LTSKCRVFGHVSLLLPSPSPRAHNVTHQTQSLSKIRHRRIKPVLWKRNSKRGAATGFVRLTRRIAYQLVRATRADNDEWLGISRGFEAHRESVPGDAWRWTVAGGAAHAIAFGIRGATKRDLGQRPVPANFRLRKHFVTESLWPRLYIQVIIAESVLLTLPGAQCLSRRSPIVRLVR
jgi:hypothetical protein